MPSLKDDLKARSPFVQLEIGEEFIGVYLGHEFVLSDFKDDEGNDQHVVEMKFSVNGNIKTSKGASLARSVAEFAVGDTLRVKKLSQKGNKITWLVEKAAVQVVAPIVDEEGKVTKEEAEKALGF